jgi:hypothetical protein
MNLRLDETEQAVVDLVRRLLAGERGTAPSSAAQARDTVAGAGLDHALRGTDESSTQLQALFAETAGASGAPWHVVATMLGVRLQLPAATALVSAGLRVRFPQDVQYAVRTSGTHCRVAAVIDRTAESQSRWTDPTGRVSLAADETALDIDAAALQAWQRLCLAAEAVGAAQTALRRTWSYVAEREQFGAPIATRQAVRHQLAELDSEAEAARLMVHEAAGNRADPAGSALAAAAVAILARRLVPTAHRFVGAIGMAEEFELHRFTGRLRSVALELGPSRRLCAEVARRWRPPALAAEGSAARA